jgi:hypothetical protein
MAGPHATNCPASRQALTRDARPLGPAEGRDPVLEVRVDKGKMAELRSRGERGYRYVVERFLPALCAADLEDDVIGTITTQDPRPRLTICDK